MQRSQAVIASGVALLFYGAAFAQESGRGVGYPSVASALNAMRGKPGVAIANENGWTIITDRASMTLWSFTPSGHPAHPSAVRRAIVQEGDKILVRKM